MRGHITKRSKDSWTIVLDLGRDPSTGKRKQQWVTHKGTKKEAETKLTKLLGQLNNGWMNILVPRYEPQHLSRTNSAVSI